MHVVRFGILKRVPWEGHEKVVSEQGSTDGFPGDTRIHFCSPATSWLLPMYDIYDAVLPFGRRMGLQRHLSLPLVFRNRQAGKADPMDSSRGNGYSKLPPLYNPSDVFYLPLISGP